MSSPSPELNPGTEFGRYTINSELGRGGMGRVMLATDSVLHRQVALKILLPNMIDKEEVVARFFREARLAAQLTHPNAVHVYDLGEALGMPFIAMEYVEGKPLTAYLGDSHIAAERKLRWLVDVAKGLSAAHARGLLHRDMKPANVMVSKEDVAKVVDFGLAKRELPTAEVKATFQTAQGFLIGTPAYMAPEQLEAGENIDARADQFGWALTAYALMLGKNLRKEDPLLFGPIPLLSDKVPGVSRRAAEIVMRALSNDREMRFPSMDALVAELEPAIQARGYSQPPGNKTRNPFEITGPMPQEAHPTKVSPPAPPVSAQPTPKMGGLPMGGGPGSPASTTKFCPDCGLSFAMPSTRCKGPHVAAFPKPPGVDDSDH
jgi:eukaryotic-like serine/threonine-protein kinase